MVQDRFTKEEATFVQEAVEEIFNGLSKSKKTGFIGHLNDILLFLSAAKEAAPK